ncbi:alpha/beta fold hydrolase [Streptomyces sp. SID5785]|uniref:alpha/beta fold hydrolase n=1 Tax=Streptomyces sp. SID5785 TaxID=2690309 RepID=UPI001361169B|nr:alpha/beta fold hydrolase [Streptomyces sp. SID5785]
MQRTKSRRLTLGVTATAVLAVGVPLTLQGSDVAPALPAHTTTTAAQATSATGPGGAGRLESAEPLTHLDPALASSAARAERILYHSRSLKGDDITVSGAVLTPKGTAPEGGWPVVSWAHGSSGISDRCAPSTAPDANGDIDLYGYGDFVAELLDAGYAVAATDYEGLGTDGDHPYIVADSEGRSVIDAARAAMQADPSLSRSVTFVGHSQGGQAAIAAGELATTWGRGLDVRGTVGLAPVTNVGVAYSYGTPGPVDRGFYLLALHGLKSEHPELRYDQFLGSQALAMMPQVEKDCTTKIWEDFSKNLGDQLNDYQFAPQDPGAALKMQTWLDEQSVPRRKTSKPMLLLQGDQDPSIRISVTKQAARNAGAPAEFRLYPGKDHYSVLTPRSEGGAATDVVDWLHRHDRR